MRTQNNPMGAGLATAHNYSRSFDTKRDALRALRRIRSTHPNAKVFCESRLFTVPFRGITVANNYILRA